MKPMEIDDLLESINGVKALEKKTKMTDFESVLILLEAYQDSLGDAQDYFLRVK